MELLGQLDAVGCGSMRTMKTRGKTMDKMDNRIRHAAVTIVDDLIKQYGEAKAVLILDHSLSVILGIINDDKVTNMVLGGRKQLAKNIRRAVMMVERS